MSRFKGYTPPKLVPIFFFVKAYMKNHHFTVFIMIRISQTHVFSERIGSYPSDGKPFCVGYRLNILPTEQETNTSILQAFGPW